MTHTPKRGRGRPAIGPDIHIRIPEDTITLIDTQAQETSNTRSALIRQYIQDGIDRTTTTDCTRSVQHGRELAAKAIESKMPLLIDESSDPYDLGLHDGMASALRYAQGDTPQDPGTAEDPWATLTAAEKETITEALHAAAWNLVDKHHFYGGHAWKLLVKVTGNDERRRERHQ